MLFRVDEEGALPIYPDGLCNFTSDWNIAGRVCKDGKTVYLTIGHLNGEDEKHISLADFAGRMEKAQILYPSFAGSICLEEDAIAVNVPQKAAILVKHRTEIKKMHRLSGASFYTFRLSSKLLYFSKRSAGSS